MAEVGTGRQPYRFQCWQCGTTLAGWRTTAEQQLPCSKCGARLRVLPRSPWPIYETLVPQPPAPLRRPPSLWLLVPFIALALVWLVGPGKLWQRLSQSTPTLPTLADWHKVEAALAQQDWNEAAVRARRILEAVPNGSDLAALDLRRQAMAVLEELPALKELSPASLRELLAEAQRTPYGQWHKRWQENYHHRRLAWRLCPPSVSGMPSLADLGLDETQHAIEWNLKPHEMDQLQRLQDVAFTLQLESCQFEAIAGVVPRWVVRFAPASLQRLTPARLPFFGDESLPAAVAQRNEELRQALARWSEGSAKVTKLPRRVLLQNWLKGAEEIWVFEGTPQRLLFVHVQGQPCRIRVLGSLGTARP